MSSQHVRPLLSAYVDGEATPAERRQVEDHLVGCAECAAVLAEYRSIGSNVRALPRPVPPPTLHRDVWTAIEANRGRAAWGANLAGLLRWGAVGATALAAIVIALVLWPKPPPAAGVQMTRPVNGQTNVGVNSPVILHFQPPVTEFAKEQVRVSPNVDASTVYASWIVTGTDLEMGLNYPPGVVPGRDVPMPHWPPLSVITITVQGPVYTQDGQSVLIKGGELKQFTFTTGTQLDPTDTPSPIPTDTPTPVPPTETPIVPTPELPPTETAVVPPPETPVPPTRQPPVIVTETAVPPPPTRQPTVPPPPTVTTAPIEPTRPPVPTPPSVTPLPPVPTPPSVTPIPPSATPAPPSATPLPPTATPEPTGVAVPTPTFVLPPPQGTPGGQPTPPPPVSTATPDNGAARGTPTLEPMSGTPRVPSPTPATTPSAVAGCPNLPRRGFGQVYNSESHAALRQTLGCPSAPEAGFASAAEQNFEHGYMFWNGDTKRIYVFSTTTNTWRSYADTWTEGTPPATLLTPPAGTYQPVRGFGKIWLDNPEVRQALGWATGQERSIQAAWQAFAHGAMLWTDSRLIRVLYDSGGWELYYDTYTGP